jgi:hypothetical protein
MPPALVHDLEEPEEHAPVQGKRDTGLIANWRILAVTLYMGVALFQYGFDSKETLTCDFSNGFEH